MVTGCANPSYFHRNTQFVPSNWSYIAVLPFTGDRRFIQVATDTFNLHLLQQNDFIVIEPATVQFAMKKTAIRENMLGDITILEAKQIGQMIDADAVFLGNVTAYNNGTTMNGFATVKLIDIETGKIVAVSHKPSGLLIGYSEHQAVVTAVERTAKDMLKVLKKLTTKNQTLIVI